MSLCFWQYPCKTEFQASIALSSVNDTDCQACSHDPEYIALPWATWIDLDSKGQLQLDQRVQLNFHLRTTASRVQALQARSAGAGASPRILTVCQHIYWQRAMPWFKQLGITDLLLSHCPLGREGAVYDGITLHPWSLYAVNVEDPNRNMGIVRGKANSSKMYLASFIGAHADHYVSDHRKRLLAFANEPGFHIELTNIWHFERQVYQQQLKGDHQGAMQTDTAATLKYNEVLSDSVFSLCPAGAGANTIRLWESLAVGSIPVVIGPRPALPRDRGAKPVAWEDAVLFISEAEFERLPAKLRSIGDDERNRRQAACMKLYQALSTQTPFEALGLPA